MPRSPLAEIDHNTQKRTELSPQKRGRIFGRYEAGQSPAQIARNLAIPPSTQAVYETIQVHPRRDHGKSAARPGRPRTLSLADERYLQIIIKKDPFLTFREIRERSGLTFSRPTFYKVLKRSGYAHWKAKRRPRLKPSHAKKRLQWALEHKDWTWEEWSKIIWSDECSVELGKGKQNAWVFGLNQPSEKWKSNHILPYSKGKGLSIMIWGAFFGGGHSDINVMVRDELSKRQGYSAASYLKILEDNLLAIYEPGMEYMQDNASIHTAKIIKEWLQNHGIRTTTWPPYSPDLNPIEHAWAKLKERIYQLDPAIESFSGTENELYNRFRDLIERAWEDLHQDYFDELIKSMDSRVNAVLEAKGWYTRY